MISQINHSAGTNVWTPLDPESQALFNYAHVAHEQSGGLFDITSGVLRKVWDFNRANLPEKSAIREQLSKVGWSKVKFSPQGIRLTEAEMELDFGGIVKEYAADAVVKILLEQGANHALIDLAGDLAVTGPHPNGSPWKIGIRHPEDPQSAMATISLTNGGLASSGNYERCFEYQGQRYSHLLNPETGMPVQGIMATSVWAPQCVVAGSIATIAMLKPEIEGHKWLKECGTSYVCMGSDLRVTSNFE